MAPQTETPAGHAFHRHPHDRRLLPIQIRQHGGVATISVRGEIDLVNHECLRSATDSVLQSSASALVLDLTEVTFLACAGMSVLVDTAERAENSGIALRLACANRAVLRPLRLAGLSPRFRIHSTLRHALDDVCPRDTLAWQLRRGR